MFGFLTILYLLALLLLGPASLAAGMLLQRRGGLKPPFKKSPGKALLAVASAIAAFAAIVNPAVWYPGFFGSSGGNLLVGLLTLSIGILVGVAFGYLLSEGRLGKLGDFVQSLLDKIGESEPQPQPSDEGE